MGVVKTVIFKLLEQYPEYREQIRYFFSVNSDFKALCDDLYQCSEALDYWNRSGSADALIRSKEYLALKSELEQELIRFIKDSELEKEDIM